MDELIRKSLKSAEANQHLIGLDAKDSRIAELIRRNDAVMVLWFYPEGDDMRVGALPVKGYMGELPDVEFVTCTTIPCKDEAAARAIVALYGGAVIASRQSH